MLELITIVAIVLAIAILIVLGLASQADGHLPERRVPDEAGKVGWLEMAHGDEFELLECRGIAKR